MNTVEIKLKNSRIMPVAACIFYVAACITPWGLVEEWGWYPVFLLFSVGLVAGIPYIYHLISRLKQANRAGLATITLAGNNITHIRLASEQNQNAASKVISIGAYRILMHYIEIKAVLEDRKTVRLSIFPDMLTRDAMRQLRRALLTTPTIVPE